MRQFVVVGHDAPTTPDFELDDLPGGAGRLDVLCRCVGSALFLSHGIREDVRIHLVLGEKLAVCFDSTELRGVNPDERNIGGLIREALAAADDIVGHRPVESSPGITVRRRDLAGTLEDVGGLVVVLDRDGTPVAEVAPPAEPTFVLSDHREFTDGEAELLAERAAHRVSLGPQPLHADHAIAIAHNYLDTSGYDRYV